MCVCVFVYAWVIVRVVIVGMYVFVSIRLEFIKFTLLRILIIKTIKH